MHNKLHILFLCSWYPSDVSPTNGDFIQRHAEAVSTQHLVSTLHIISKQNIKKSYFETKKINNVSSYIGYVKPTANPLLKSIRFFSMYKKLINQIASFDLIHLNVTYPMGLFALYQKWLYQIPFIISEHWTGYLKTQSKKISFLEKKITKTIIRKACFVCPVSEKLKISMEQLGLLGNYNVVGNVIDTHIFKPEKEKEKSFTIIHISSLNDLQKNITGMLETAKKLEDKIGAFTWKFIGGESTDFKEKIKDLNFKQANIQFINHLTQLELSTHLQKAHICVSFSNYETFGLTMVESLAAGTSVISTNTGILTELPKQDFFTIIQKNDNKSLLAVLLNHYTNPSKDRFKMHSFVSTKFSRSTIAETFSKLYSVTIKNKK